MVELIQMMVDFFCWLGLIWSLVSLSVLYFLVGIRTVRTGCRAIYFRLGKVVSEVNPGVHWRPFPFYRMTKCFCAEQYKDLTVGLQEVVTNDGVTCKIEGGITYEITNLMDACTKVYDSDEQMAVYAMDCIREAVTNLTYTECIAEEFGKIMLKNVANRVKKWGLRIIDLNIITFTPANNEARTLVFLLQAARLRAQTAELYIDALEKSKTKWRKLGVNPSVLLAAIAGGAISTVAPTDQLSAMRSTIQEMAANNCAFEDDQPFVTRVKRIISDNIPGADIAIDVLDGIIEGK